MFSSWLEQNRKALGLTQRELGRQVGVTGGAVGMWEQGKRAPNPKNIARLGNFFLSQGIKMPPPLRRPELPEGKRLLCEITELLRR